MAKTSKQQKARLDFSQAVGMAVPVPESSDMDMIRNVQNTPQQAAPVAAATSQMQKPANSKTLVEPVPAVQSAALVEQSSPNAPVRCQKDAICGFNVEQSMHPTHNVEESALYANFDPLNSRESAVQSHVNFDPINSRESVVQSQVGLERMLSVLKTGKGKSKCVYLDEDIIFYIQNVCDKTDAKFSQVVNVLLRTAIDNLEK